MGRSRTVWLWSITAAISGAEQAIQRVWSMSDALHGLAISSALWGTVVGALAGSIPADRYGRRPTLIGIGVTNLVFTTTGVLLIDRMGRRALMYIGSLGYLVSLGSIAWGFATGHYAFVPAFIFLFIAAHAIRQGTVIWVYISGISPNAARARGQAVGSGTHWVMAALLTLAMPLMLSSLAPAAIFLLFFVMMVFQLLFVQFLMVETRGQPLETVSHGLERN
jgi:MFS family permease